MTLIQPAKLEMAYLKMGLYGGAGSGKTYTSSMISIGLHKHIKAKKPVIFLDTETGSDFVIQHFDKAKMKLHVAKSRAFKDLIEVVDEAEKNYSVLIIDSITHFWNELMDSYQKKHDLPRITLRHWVPLKQTWREFTERYVNSKLHIIMCGRVGDVWEDTQDEDGVVETKKTGTKMKAEVETAFEPSLLVEMVKHRTSPQAGAGWVHRAWIVKDRFSIIDGQFFDNPTFDSFLPHIQMLSLGGEHRAIDKDRNSQDLFKNNHTGHKRLQKRDQTLEKIKNEIYLLYPGQTDGAKQSRLKLTKAIFGTHSWNEITSMQNESLEEGLVSIEAMNNKNEKEATV